MLYAVEDDLYFSVAADPAFGQESRWTREQMLEIYADRGGDPDRPGKKDPLDCLVWRAERPGEPAWESPFGPGRPGWHVECSAMALEYLGETFDVQGGGSDLVFPHHEMCASEAQVLTGQPVRPGLRARRRWSGYDGEKMSKSRGNLVFVSALRNSDVDPMAIRLTLLRHHYRSDWEWTDAELWDSVDLLDRWRRALALGPEPRPRRCRRRAHRARDRPRRSVRRRRDRVAGPTRRWAPTGWPRPATPRRPRRSGRSSTPPSGLAL